MSGVLSIQLFHKKLFVGQPHHKLIRGSGGPSGVFLPVQGIGCRRDVSSHFQARCLWIDFVRYRLPSDSLPPWDKLLLQPSCTSSIALTAAFSSPHCVWGYRELSVVGRMNLFAATDHGFWWGKKVEVALSRMLFALSACHSALFYSPLAHFIYCLCWTRSIKSARSIRVDNNAIMCG